MIEQAAIRWLELREECRRLRSERALLECEREASGLLEPNTMRIQPKPCWKTHHRTAPDDYERMAETDWCETCREREKVHKQLRRLSASRGAALRNLIRLYKLGLADLCQPTSPRHALRGSADPMVRPGGS